MATLLPKECIRRPMSYWTTCQCDDCVLDRRRAHKLHSMGRAYRFPSEAAWQILAAKIDAGWTAKAVASACGLPDHYFTSHLADYRRDGRRRLLGPAAAAAVMNMSTPTRGSISAEPSRRRLRALARMGYSLDTLAAETGIGFSTLGMIRGTNERITVKRALAIAEVYDRLHMTAGSDAQAARQAREKGWVPPLAWDDIDDLAENPKGWSYLSTDRGDALRDLAEMGVGITEACRRLHLSRDAVERWCQRKGLNDVYLQIAGREALWENQHTREAS